MKFSKTAEGLRFDPAFEHLRPEYVVKLCSKKARLSEWSKEVDLRDSFGIIKYPLFYNACVQITYRALFSYIIIEILIMYMHYFTIASYFQIYPIDVLRFPLQHLLISADADAAPTYLAASLQLSNDFNLIP